MRIKFSFRRINATQALKDYIVQRFEKAARMAKRYHADPLFEFSAQRVTQHREGNVFEATVIVHVPQKTIVNIERAADMYSAIDKMALEIVRQLEQGREKPIEHLRRTARKFKQAFLRQDMKE